MVTVEVDLITVFTADLLAPPGTAPVLESGQPKILLAVVETVPGAEVAGLYLA